MARKKSSLGCLFYTALVLLVIVLFLFQWNRIREVVESTGFLKHLSLGGSPAPVEKPAGASRPPAAPSPEADGPGTAPNREAPPEPPPASPAGGKPAGDAGGKTGPAEGGPDSRASPPPPAERPAPLPRERAPAAAAPKPAPAARAGGAGRPVSAPAAKPSSVSPAPSAAPLPSAPLPRPPETRRAETRTREARLYFAAVDSEGAIALKEVIRPVDYTDAPLTSTLQALLKGPAPAEARQGLLTAIPAESRLNNVYVRDDTVFVDFSESFRFNPLGEEGLRAQLKQIVYSATEFPNVRKVQFLIDGKRVKYLGPEGTFIGEPLSRQSFR